MLNFSKNYQLCFDFLASLRKKRVYVNINSPLEIPSLIARNWIKSEYSSLRLSKTGVILSQVADINCQPKPLPTIYLFGPDLVGEKEAIKRSGYFMSFPKDWGKINGSAWISESAGLNQSKIAKLTSQFEEHPWMEEMISKIDKLATQEIIGISYDISLNRPRPDGSMRVVGLEAFSKIAINTIVRNFMRANTNSLLRDGLSCTPEGTVTIDETDNDLSNVGFSNKDCLKIGPSNNLLTYQAIYFLNMYGWRANIRSLSYLLACRYLRHKTLLKQKKRVMKQTFSSNKEKSLKDQIQLLQDEVKKLEKAAFNAVTKSVESLIEQGAIADVKGSYLSLGNNVLSNFDRFSMDAYQFNYLYKSIMDNIRQINKVTKGLGKPNTEYHRKTIFQRPTIYIASTCYDFRDLRQELKQSLREWGYTPWLNENSEFPVTFGINSYQACLEAVKQSDCLVLIIGSRYGGMAENRDVSITELEYITACENGIPRINFCLDTVWNLIQVRRANPNMQYPKYFSEGKEKADKIFEFLDRVRKYEIGKTDNWVHPFKNSVELKKILRRRLELMNLKQTETLTKST